jgi:SAM-dependent methyltransferase
MSTTYSFPNEWELAERRLAVLEQARDPITSRRLQAIPVRRGWRCLELGAGSGSVARWLCRHVGTEGTVVAVDIDDRLLRHLDEPNLQVVRADVVNDPLPAGPFDLVHTRMLLMHLPERDDVVCRIAPLVRPGGTVLFEENDVFPLAASTGDYGAMWRVFAPAMEATGVAPTWVRTLPALCAEAGFVDVAADVDVPMFTAADPDAEFWRLTWIQVAERLVASGAPRAVVDAGIAALTEPGIWHFGPAMVAVSARVP